MVVKEMSTEFVIWKEERIGTGIDAYARYMLPVVIGVVIDERIIA